MKILAIESSCDETAVAILEGKGKKIKILANVVSSQIAIHQKYGGVVPEIAAREHILNIIPVINEALVLAKINKHEAPKKIKAIAVTAGPGLITSLMMGVETAKTLAFAWNLPIIAVNHIEGHIHAAWLATKTPELPAIALTVSGGHNMIVEIKSSLKYKIIGDTRDDAAGEAFDKAAKILGLGYPGGPAIAKAALKADKNKLATKKINLPRPMLNDPSSDFSFSGLKTALFYAIKKDKAWSKFIPEYAYEFEQAVADTLTRKVVKAAQRTNAKTILLVGGVSANLVLRQKLKKTIEEKLPKTTFIVPPFEYTTDNAAMIAVAGYFKFLNNQTFSWQKLTANPNLTLK
ncbi:MAG: tRNA (adenosine(37)-N6)-threonylcarbamoyltransferase complex transferase subunit TsaD [Patescibacteria group bacterium]|nr:tRNA (adenosine(37)-N6)-threonylcarbamoyltransferase complex transferase subunit TsaD [Patescibacteria group bacterium]